MAQKFFIQHGERLLIDKDYGALGLEAVTVDGPMSIDTAREVVEEQQFKTSKVVNVFRVNLDPNAPNIENITEDVLTPVIEHDPDIDPDPSWTAHIRASKSKDLYV